MSQIETYTHLHCHSSGSLMDGVAKPADNAKRAAELGMQAIALTDHGTLAGLFEFQKTCEEVGVKPILGNEMYIVDDMNSGPISDEERETLSREQRKELQRTRMRTSHVILLAENQKGLENLYTLNYYANKNGYYYRPRIDLNLLRDHHEGLIATTTCVASKIARYFFNGDENLAIRHFEDMLDLFGEDKYFIEMHPHEIDMQLNYNRFLIDKIKSKYKDVKCILANDSHYARPNDNEAHKFLLSITTDDMVPGCKNLYVASEEDMRKFWHENNHGKYIDEKYLNEAIETTKEIATRCNARIDMESLKEPEFTLPEGWEEHDNKHYMGHILQNALRDKRDKGLIPEDRVDEYLERLKYEFNIIADKGYIDYFLIVMDFIKWAKDNDILVGPGRGSAAGSLLSWLLEIIEVDPIKYELSFDRFLNPLRNKAPDIDTDIEKYRREEVRDYIANKWGEANIAPIGAYARYSANSLFREVCKNLEYDFSDVNKVAKNIDSSGDEYRSLKTFKENVNEKSVIKAFMDKIPKEEAEQIYSLVGAIEGNYRNLSVAAAGTIISSRPLYEIVPLRKTKDDTIITEWDGRDLTDAKYLKIDMLGIATLSIVKNVMDRVGMTIRELYDMPLYIEDVKDPEEKKIYEKCYEEFRKGHTEAIFQFESGGITELMKNISPDSINDISATNALYRPGPLATGAASNFYKRKNKKTDVFKNEFHPTLFDNVLKETYGLIVYEEQITEMFNLLGLDYGDADILRRGMEEHDQEKTQHYLDKLLAKPESELPFSKAEVKQTFENIQRHEGYAFNKSHSLSYAIVAFWTMYMKVKYKKEFCEEVLNDHINDDGKLPMYINMTLNCFPDLKLSMGDINMFSDKFVIEDGQLKFALNTTKGIGKALIKKLLKMKNDGKVWENFQDFFMNSKISVNNIINLVKIGIFDNTDFGNGRNYNRKTLVDIIEFLEIIRSAKVKEKKPFFEKLGIDNIEGMFNHDIIKKYMSNIGGNIDQKDYSARDLAIIENDLIGFRLTGDSDEFIQAITSAGVMACGNWKSKLEPVWGKITNVDMKKTKRGQPYAVAKITDNETSISLKLWSNQLKKYGGMLINGNVIVVNLSKDRFGYALVNAKHEDTMFDEFSMTT